MQNNYLTFTKSHTNKWRSKHCTVTQVVWSYQCLHVVVNKPGLKNIWMSDVIEAVPVTAIDY